ncbi:MAG: type VI secretion system baseplate subunit TssG [Planctomycetota bacterium]
METAQRQSNPALVGEILERPGAFDFFRAVEILEGEVRRAGGAFVGSDRGMRGAGANFTGPEIRFRVEPTLGFAAAPISKVAHERQSYQLAVSFLGLVGSSGTLPVHYTETLLHRLHQKDYALQTFLDALQDRTVALFYRAWKKHRPTVAFAETNRALGQADPILEMFLGLVGRLPRARGKAIGSTEWSEVHHAGHFSERRRSARGLKILLEGLLRCTVRVEQFVGQWIELDEDALSRLGDRESFRERCNYR